MHESVKRALASAKAPKPSGKVTDPELEADFPILHAFMTEVVGENGRPRKPATLLLFVDDLGFKGLLNEREAELCLWSQASTLQGCLHELEALLGSKEVPWRKASGQRQQDWKNKHKK